MSKISFKNFRGFIDFPEMEFGGITFLVGKNNAGKSTAIKALLLIIDYLMSNETQTFSFDNGKMGDYVNIKTFGRAKNKETKDDFIEFNLQINEYLIQIIIKGKEGDLISSVESLTIKDRNLDYSLVFNGGYNVIWHCKCKQEKVNDFNPGVTALVGYGNGLIASLHSVSSHMGIAIRIAEKDIVKISDNDRSLYNTKNKTDETLEKEKAYIQQFKGSINRLITTLERFNIRYIGASLPKQVAVLNVKDKDNSLAQAVHEYSIAKEKYHTEYPGDQFIKDWINTDKFDIGDDFKIENIEGEAYLFYVKNNQEWISIADRGMGAMQIMTILLRLAIKVSPQFKREEIIIFEEPELNLHPAWQSKLADLFYYVNSDTKNRVKIIIETHSEYLIRKTQVIVANRNYKDQKDVDENNQFKVYYFPKNKLPYDMQYRTDGKFSNEFETGFFDETNKLIFEIL